MLNLLDELNPEQRLAAETVEGPVLILAGAGTGKTRAITYRMANLIANGVPAEAILAVTFTNKAAEEMRNRVSDLLLRAGVPPAQPWLSTFHSLCARLLRREATAAGLPRDFSIYDDDDQLAAVKLAMGKLQIDDDSLTPRNVLSRISYEKNHGQSAEQMRAEAFDQDGRRLADIFAAYEKLLHDSKALDFDDLLLRSARLLRESTATRLKWQARFQYIHVDEYQDTNRVQYELMRLLTGPQQNVCVVGDEDQSIYRWRGADVSILLSFSRDFPAARIVKLERNYRSTQQILNAAGAVVANNPERLGKSLSAEKGEGTNLKYFEARDAQAEAEFVAGELERIINDDSDQTCAVEYRTNFQSRAFEEVFRRRGLRYKLVGGFSFYNRAEVKDALAYVRLAMHPEDDISLLRVLNVPPRGIGKTTVDALREAARVDASSLWTAIEKFISGASAGRAVTPLRAFRETDGNATILVVAFHAYNGANAVTRVTHLSAQHGIGVAASLDCRTPERRRACRTPRRGCRRFCFAAHAPQEFFRRIGIFRIGLVAARFADFSHRTSHGIYKLAWNLCQKARGQGSAQLLLIAKNAPVNGARHA